MKLYSKNIEFKLINWFHYVEIPCVDCKWNYCCWRENIDNTIVSDTLQVCKLYTPSYILF